MRIFPKLNRGTLAAVAFQSVIISTVNAGPGNYNQQGPKLIGSGSLPGLSGGAGQGSASISADGNTALIGGGDDDLEVGAVWVFTRSGGTWTQQGPKLVGTGGGPPSTGQGGQGGSVALSGDGNTAVVGASSNCSGGNCAPAVGAVWVFARSGGIWSQQGNQLVGSGAVVNNDVTPGGQGQVVVVAADGNTLAESAPYDDSGRGAVWVFTRSTGIWTQQGDKLVDSLRVPGFPGSVTGSDLSLSADGNTLAVRSDAPAGSGSVLMFKRVGGIWTLEQRIQLNPGALFSGYTVSLTGDGNTLLAFGNFFHRKNGVWSPSGNPLISPNGHQLLFRISADGSTVVGGDCCATDTNGHLVLYVLSGGVWSQHNGVFSGSGATAGALQGASLALSANGNTLIEGGGGDNHGMGATWIFATPQLATSLTHAGNFRRGQLDATYAVTVKNVGDRDVHALPESVVNVVDHIPAGLTAIGIEGSGWSCTLATISCTRNDGLPVGASYPPITVTVNVASSAPASVTNLATASGGGSNWGNAKDVTTIVP